MSITSHRTVYTGPDADEVATVLRLDGIAAHVVAGRPPMVIAVTPWCDTMQAAALADRVGSGLRLVREVGADRTPAPVRFEVCA